ncbi:hypothetical protein ACQ1Q5_09240 [Ornithobacterium rhinotracheale]
MIPRVALIATNDKTPASNPSTSLLVYNTSTSGSGSTAVTPGFYYWLQDTDTPSNSKWVRIANVNEQNVYTAGKGMFLQGNEFYRTGLEEITENGKTGWRLIGVNSNNYGDIGQNAVDLSISPNESTNIGARGDNSFASGFQPVATGVGSVAIGTRAKASGEDAISLGTGSVAEGKNSTAIALGKAMAIGSVAIGYGSTASKGYGIAMGFKNTSSGLYSIAIGRGCEASASYSVAIGNNASAASYGATAMGMFNTKDNTPDTSISNKSKRLFVLGNGSGIDAESDALTVLRSGKLGVDIDRFQETTSDAKVQVNGEIKISDNNIPCNASNEGSIRYTKSGTTGVFQGCRQNGTSYEWTNLN